MAFRRGFYMLTPPTWPVFTVAVVLGALSAIVHYRLVPIPALSAHSYELALASAILLAAGALFRGL